MSPSHLHGHVESLAVSVEDPSAAVAVSYQVALGDHVREGLDPRCARAEPMVTSPTPERACAPTNASRSLLEAPESVSAWFDTTGANWMRFLRVMAPMAMGRNTCGYLVATGVSLPVWLVAGYRAPGRSRYRARASATCAR